MFEEEKSVCYKVILVDSGVMAVTDVRLLWGERGMIARHARADRSNPLGWSEVSVRYVAVELFRVDKKLAHLVGIMYIARADRLKALTGTVE